MARVLLVLQGYVAQIAVCPGETLIDVIEFWTNRLAATDPPLEMAQTRIPEIPDQTEFLERWNEFHQGYRMAKREDGTEQRMSVIGEPLKEVTPGFLPRTLDQLRAGVENDARRPENRLRRRRLSFEEEQPAGPQQSLDSALDSLLAEASDDESPQQVQETPAPQPVEAPQPAEQPRPLNRGEARLQRARERFARVFGSREDIQQADYESPLSTMYNRAYDRYHQAEERRATDTTAPPPLDGLSVRERREIEEQLLWGVMRESANQAESEDNVWSYAPRTTPSGRIEMAGGEARNMYARTAAMRLFRQQQAAAFSNYEGTSQPVTYAAPSAAFPATAGPTSSTNASSSAESGRPNMAALLRHQTRYEAMLRERMAEYERLRPNIELSNPRPEDESQPDNPSVAPEPNHEEITDIAPSSGPTVPSSRGSEGMSQIQTSIQQITAELQRLRVASDAITSARHSMNAHLQHAPERPPQTLDNQPGRPAAMNDEEMTRKLECQVCYQQLADVALLPCGHMVMCQWCADVVIPVKHSHLPIRPSKCPMCRKVVKQRFKIHMG
jgi:hypothetical protein